MREQGRESTAGERKPVSDYSGQRAKPQCRAPGAELATGSQAISQSLAKGTLAQHSPSKAPVLARHDPQEHLASSSFSTHRTCGPRVENFSYLSVLSW